MTDTNVAVPAIVLIKKPTTVGDYENNARFYHAALTKATEAYNDSLAAYNRAVELESVAAGTVIAFLEGKGETAEQLSGSVITKLADGKYQVLVQYAEGTPAKLLAVKPSDIVHVYKPDGEQVEVQTDEAA